MKFQDTCSALLGTGCDGDLGIVLVSMLPLLFLTLVLTVALIVEQAINDVTELPVQRDTH